jgi:hypothetical protein
VTDVIGGHAAEHRRDERVVDTALARLRGALQVVERDVEHVEPAAEPALGHHR